MKDNILKISIFNSLINLSFALPIIVLFWLANNLSFMEIMLLQSLFAIAIVFLEAPTGYFADIYGRKTSLILSAVSVLLGVLVYSLGHNFYEFLFAEMLMAIGFSFVSGADSALVYDTLKEEKQENSFKKVWGNIMFYGLIASSASSLIGGIIGSVDFRWTFYIELPFLLIAVMIAYSLKEPKAIRKEGRKAINFNDIIYAVKTNKLLIVYSALITTSLGIALWLYQPYLKLSGLNVAYFGIIFAMFNIIAAIGSKYAYKLKILGRYILILSVFLIGASYFLMSNFVFLFSFTFAFVQQFVRGYSKPIIDDCLNKKINSKVRATALSVNNMVGKLIYALVLPIVGYLIDIYSLIQTLLFLGVIICLIGIVMLMIKYNNQKHFCYSSCIVNGGENPEGIKNRTLKYYRRHQEVF